MTKVKAKAQAKALTAKAKQAIKTLPKQPLQSRRQLQRQNSNISGTHECRKTRDLDKEVYRLLSKRWPWLGDAQMHGKAVEDLTLFECVKLKKVEATLKGKYISDEVWIDFGQEV